MMKEMVSNIQFAIVNRIPQSYVLFLIPLFAYLVYRVRSVEAFIAIV